jgi:hypothetical protein
MEFGRPQRHVLAGFCVAAGALLWTGSVNAPGLDDARPDSWLRTATSRAASPSSCKPTAPLYLTLRSPATPGNPWEVVVEGIEPITELEVTTWVRTLHEEGSPQSLWYGALARGEVRRLELRPAVSSDAIEVCAQAEVRTGSAAIERALARLPVGAGVARQAQFLAAGRLVPDGEGGAVVLEFTGHEEGSR